MHVYSPLLRAAVLSIAIFAMGADAKAAVIFNTLFR